MSVFCNGLRWHVRQLARIIAAQNAVSQALSQTSLQALQMDCLPAGRDGRPLDPARDFAVIGWASTTPLLFLPILIGQSIKLFPSHEAAYRCMYLLGSAINGVAWLIFALLVHPNDEALGRAMQCTRGWFHRLYDADRRQFGDGGARCVRHIQQRGRTFKMS